MKLKLPDVTLVAIETREHELQRMAIEDCISKVEFADVLILTDRPMEFMGLTHFCAPRIHTVPDWSDKLGWCKAMWFTVPLLMRTSHMLAIQWDSWVWDTSMWRDEYLEYDFVGAPWWYKDGLNVGNSGFCLKSTRLARYIHDRRAQYQCVTTIEDDLLCRKYRPRLQEAGFVWAPEVLAHDFAFECERPSKTTRHFGFHGMFNWPVVLDHDKLFERIKVASKSEYIRDGYLMKTFCQFNPQLIAELKETLNGSDLGVSRQADA